MPEVSLPNDWWPRAYQMPTWRYFERGGKRAVSIWHRRSGKDDLALNHTAIAAIERPAVYWHCLPEYAQARKAIWEAVNPHTGVRRIDQAFPKAIRAKTREDEMMIELVNGSIFRLVGSDRVDSLVGASLGGVNFSEYALADQRAWAFIRPILAESNGWAHFITTPRGRNHAYELYRAAEEDDEWFADRLSATETGVFTPEALEKEREGYIREYGGDAGLALFRQEYECSFEVASENAYISSTVIADAREREVHPFGPVVIGVDPARFGRDRSTILARVSNAIVRLNVYRGMDTVDLAGHVADIANELNAQAIFVDGNGVGAGVVDVLRRSGFRDLVSDVQFGGKARKDDRYYNKRAECWGEMREWLASQGSIANAPRELDDDLSSPEYEFDNKNRVLLESKDDMRKRGLPSPDIADALSLTFANPTRAAGVTIRRTGDMPSQATIGHSAAKKYRR